MPAIQSKLDTSGEAFQRNRASMLALVAQLRSLETRASDASAKAKPLFDKRGQLLPRERIARLLDPGAPWLELSSIAGYCRDNPDPEKSIPGGGMIVISPMLLALGLPLEGLAIMMAVNPITDRFSTIGNVAADMAMTAILAARAGRG